MGIGLDHEPSSSATASTFKYRAPLAETDHEESEHCECHVMYWQRHLVPTGHEARPCCRRPWGRETPPSWNLVAQRGTIQGMANPWTEVLEARRKLDWRICFGDLEKSPEV